MKWYHGRNDGKQPQTTANVILCTENPEENSHYAKGARGIMYEVIPQKVTKVEQIQQRTKNYLSKHGNLGPEIDEWIYDVSDYEKVISEMNPKNIVDSAGFWDNLAFVTWFIESELYKDDVAIRTQDGLVVLDASKTK